MGDSYVYAPLCAAPVRRQVAQVANVNTLAAILWGGYAVLIVPLCHASQLHTAPMAAALCLITSYAPQAFCAGGDVKTAVLQAASGDFADPDAFFHTGVCVKPCV